MAQAWNPGSEKTEPEGSHIRDLLKLEFKAILPARVRHCLKIKVLEELLGESGDGGAHL